MAWFLEMFGVACLATVAVAMVALFVMVLVTKEPAA